MPDITSTPDSSATGAAGADEARRQAHLRSHQVNLLSRQWTRSPFVVAIVCGFVVYTVAGSVSPYAIAAWALGLLALLFARRPYVVHLLRHPPADPRRELRRLLGFAFAHGAFIGIAALLFHGALPEFEQVVLTLILVCWTAGGVAAAAAYAPAFYVYLVPALLPLAALWAGHGSVEGIGLAVLILLYAVILVFFVRDNERVVQESFAIRYENERLVQALELEQQEVMLARDRAEEANLAKSRFLAAASHDLRQPLHALSLYSGALSLQAPYGDIGEIAGHIDEALTSLSSLVNSLLDISKLDAGAVKPEQRRINLKLLVERLDAVYRPVAREKGLDFRIAPVDVEVETDPGLLERVLRNLVDNAIKYTSGGSVAVTTELGEHTVRISVRDTGLGISEPEREHIFEEFYQVGNAERDRARGLGLGLAIVQRLATLLELEVEVESQPGHGSTFSVTLKRMLQQTALAPEGQSKGMEPARQERLVGKRVLVIDDERGVRLGMRALLESWGCRVATCGGYVEAQHLLDEHHMGVDVIVADLRLREHENGIDTIRRLREQLGEVPALLVSGDTAPERLREAQRSGLPFLHKPVAAENLRQAMLAALA